MVSGTLSVETGFRVVSDTVSDLFQTAVRHVFKLASETVSDPFQTGFRHGFRHGIRMVSDQMGSRYSFRFAKARFVQTSGWI